jgi:hypothetical protein
VLVGGTKTVDPLGARINHRALTVRAPRDEAYRLPDSTNAT